MARIDNAIKWCLDKGEKGGSKHTGLRKILPDKLESENQLKKAKSDLETMQYLYKGNKTDWVASTAFYAMYHSLLSVLYYLGYESRNQECTIILIENLIAENIIDLEQDYIDIIRNAKNDDARSIREEMQYGSKTSMDDKRCISIMTQAKKFVSRIEEVMFKLNDRLN
jgi:uncharacterized protein (UPF0332 family)